MKELRKSTFVWVTWLTKLMSGENQCMWASWFRTHYKWDKVPSDFDLVKWTADHNELSKIRVNQLKEQGFTVYTEDQNSFHIEGKTGIHLSGKADIVAIKGDEAYVEDCKTGNPRHSDHMQVMIYMLSLPLATTHCKGLKLNGRIIYKNSIVDIPSEKIDDSMKQIFKDTIHKIGQDTPPLKTPSWGECRFCDITKVDCPERIETEPVISHEEHDLF